MKSRSLMLSTLDNIKNPEKIKQKSNSSLANNNKFLYND